MGKKTTEETDESQTPEQSTEGEGVGQWADDLAGSMPETQPHAIEAEREDEAKRKEEAAGLTDKDGNPFDPSIHRAEADGSPKVSPNGWLMKKPGRGSPKSKEREAGNGGPRSKVGGTGERTQGPTQEETDEAQYQAAAEATVSAIVSLGYAIGGQEAQPRQEDWDGMVRGWTAYYRSKGTTEFPPWLQAAIPTSAYFGNMVASGPNTRKRLQDAGAVIKSRWQRWREKRAEKRGKKREARQQAEEDARSEAARSGTVAGF